MCSLQDFKDSLSSVGFACDRDTYELYLSIDVCLRLSDRTGVVKLLAISSGVPVHLLEIDIAEPFNLYQYLKYCKDFLLAYHRNEQEVFSVIKAITSWLQAYKTGYTFQNFADSCMKDTNVSYMCHLNNDYEDVVCFHILKHERVWVHYNRLVVAKLSLEEISLFREPYEVLHKYASEFHKVKIHIRKTIINEFLAAI